MSAEMRAFATSAARGSLILPVSADFLVGDDALPIMNGPGRAEFLSGWRPLFVYTGLRPVFVLCLQHTDGSFAPWYLDERMHRTGGTCAELPASVQLDLTASCCRLFDSLWDTLILDPSGRLVEPNSRDFFALPPAIREELVHFYLHALPPPPACLPCDSVAGGYVIDAGGRRIVVRSEHLAQIFHPHRVQDQTIEVLARGRFTFPSPVDGHEVAASGALYLGVNSYAYCFFDTAHRLAFYVVCSEIYFRSVCLFIPAARAMLSPTPAASQAGFPNFLHTLYLHLARYGGDIDAGRGRPHQSPTHIWYGQTALHLGHVLWNDISGVEQIVHAVPQHRLPPFLLFDAGVNPEMYGPLDAIFPELSGRIVRDGGSYLEGVPELYRGRVLPLRRAGMVVTQNVRDRIMAVIDQAPRWSEERRRSGEAAASGPLIMLGLRTENRTIPDLAEFCVELVRHLAHTLGRATVVIDGHNARGDSPDELIWSHGEIGRSRQPPVVIERDIVRRMEEASVGTCIGVLNTIGHPVSTSLIWCRASHCFVTMWGAGLAKYRWVCNKPGLVITNRYNVASRAIVNTMNIYSDPLYMEDPTPITFIDEAAVEDLPDAPMVVDHGNADPTLTNFRLDWAAAFRALDTIVQATVP